MKRLIIFNCYTKQFICLLLFITFTLNGYSQGQQKKWCLNGQEIDFSNGDPVVNSLPSSVAPPPFPGGIGSANSFYGPDDNLLFYVIGNTIFSKDGVAIDVLFSNNAEIRGEIGIVPVPGSTCKFYIIYSRTIDDVPNVHAELLYSEFDLTLDNNQGGITNTKRDVSLVSWDDVSAVRAGIAISSPTQNGTHFLYVVSNEDINVDPSTDITGRLRRFTISSNEINTTPVIVHERAVEFASSGAGYNPVEIDLSHDGRLLAITNADNFEDEATILHLNPTTGNLDLTMGDNNTGVTNFTMAGPISGVEFRPNNQELFLSVSGTGIVRRDLITNTNSTILSSEIYGNSQIELASNNRMYFGSVTSPTDIGDFDLTNNTFQANAISGLSSTATLIFADPVTGQIVTFPDQIDGYDYQNFYTNVSGECCRAIGAYETTAHDVNDGISTTWESGSNPFNDASMIRVQDELRVSNNSSLTIRNMTLEFAEGARVVVEIGSRLTIDGTTLTTTNCETTWAGIQVWGDSDDNQTSSTQGTLILRNQSVIEHARTAIRMYSTLGGGSTNTTGGILYADDTDFINNRVGIQFLRYQNFNPSNNNSHLPNRSRIRHCDFTINDDYRFSKPMYGHIRLWAVDGIAIANCNFSSEQTGIPSQDRGYAIRSSSASFRVSATCTAIVSQGVPCPGYYESRFSGFDRAIWAYGNNQHGAYSVNRASFDNNLTAIYSRGVNNPTVIKSTFDIGPWFSNDVGGIRYGIYLDTGTGYTIEQNDFAEPSGNFPSTVGVYAFNTGSDHNQIYNNSFTGLTAGNYAHEQNRENPDISDGPGGQGLRYFCNQNSSNRLDFYVRGDQDFHGIATNQGVMPFNATANAIRSAGNTFSHNGFPIFTIYFQ
jgi:hypothetical protein